jgi:hypothetical protein
MPGGAIMTTTQLGQTKPLAPICSIADGHGTHCSGIIGAVDNAQGVRGAIGSGVRIHAHACLNETGTGGDSDVSFAAALLAAGRLQLGMPAPRAAKRVAETYRCCEHHTVSPAGTPPALAEGAAERGLRARRTKPLPLAAALAPGPLAPFCRCTTA